MCIVLAHSQADISPSNARTMGITSIVFSVIGIVAGIILYILLILWLVQAGLAVAATSAALADVSYTLSRKLFSPRCAACGMPAPRAICSACVNFFFFKPLSKMVVDYRSDSLFQ